MQPSSPEPPPKSYSLTNELAKERNRAAAERTLMAWIRTSLALISFGFGIDQVVAALAARGGDIARTSALSRVTGLSFIAVGIYAMVAAILEHRRILTLIQRDDYIYYRTRSLGIHVAIALIGIGAFAFGAIIVDALLD
ncbi:YidH family protein [Leptolyngbya sp. AN02str]|uniref:YidH family protein n=1 Tax=Leptolyngbya sp. AN02str TaxID=3423363 RepID=UPI003D3144C8